MQSWIDVSIALRHGLVPWPGDPPFRINRVSDIARGDVCTFSTLSMSAHAGTHIDAPLHFLDNGRPVDALPIDVTVGLARVITIRNTAVIAPDELRKHRIRSGERVLFKTRNSSRHRQAEKFFKDYVAVSPDAARYLVSRRVRMVGIDGHSIGPFREGMAETHQVLLGAGIWVIEGLDPSRAFCTVRGSDAEGEEAFRSGSGTYESPFINAPGVRTDQAERRFVVVEPGWMGGHGPFRGLDAPLCATAL